MFNRLPVQASLFFLLYFGATGAIQPYLNLYYEDRGMSHAQIGYLAALPTITGVIAAPLWSAAADILRRHRLILVGAMCCTLIPVGMLMQATRFSTLALSVVLIFLFLSPIIPLADHAILSGLKNRDSYGRVRLWGSIGWAAAAWGSGILVEQSSLSVAALIFFAFMIPNIYITSRLPAPPQQETENSYIGDMLLMIRNPTWLGSLMAIFLAGTGLSILMNYFPLYLKALDAGEGLYGLSVSVSALSELPFFFLSPLLIRRFTPRGVLLIAFMTLAIRAFLTSQITDPRWAIPVQLLHGPSFAGMWTAGVIFIRQISPERIGASVQSAIGISMFGAAGVAGALIGAQLYDNPGAVATFQIAGLIALGGFILFWFVGRLPDANNETSPYDVVDSLKGVDHL